MIQELKSLMRKKLIHELCKSLIDYSINLLDTKTNTRVEKHFALLSRRNFHILTTLIDSLKNSSLESSSESFRSQRNKGEKDGK